MYDSSIRNMHGTFLFFNNTGLNLSYLPPNYIPYTIPTYTIYFNISSL